MKYIINFTVLFISILFITSSCENKKEPVNTPGISGEITNHSECKSVKSGILKSAYPDTVSCVHYVYSAEDHTVTMNHINAGFNCCPGKLYCTVAEYNDTILIREFETEQGCNCDCLFDLDIELQDVDQMKYQVVFIEPYVQGTGEISFEMDLTSGFEGEFCVVRKGYPWGF